MKIKKNSINMMYIYILTFLSILSYEIHIYEKYKYVQLIISAFTVISFIFITYRDKNVLNRLKNNIKNNKIILLLIVCMLISTIVISTLDYTFSIVSFLSVLMFMINICFFFLIVPIVLNTEEENIRKYKTFLTTVITIIGIIAIIIGIKGSFFSYSKIELRSASIYFDPNFLAVLLAISVCLNIDSKNKKVILSNIINVLAIYYTGSRGTALSFIISIIIYYTMFTKTKILKKIIVTVIICVTSALVLNYLYKNNYFRVYQGSNGRIAMYEYAFKMIEKKPIFGYGYSNIGGIFLQNGFKNTSTHNSIIDFAVSYGIPTTIVFLIIILRTIFRVRKNNEHSYIVFTIIFMLINMNTVLYSLGGVGISSLLLTIFLGCCNYNGGKNNNEKLKN